jgi:hypothetical protein
MYRLLLNISLILFLSQTAVISAQNDRDKLEALHMNFISRRLDLTTSESEKFWPVYNEYNDKIRSIRKKLKEAYRQNPQQISDQEAEEIYNLDLLSKQAEADVHKLYSARLRLVIGARKLLKLRIAEEDFKREVINTIKDRRE